MGVGLNKNGNNWKYAVGNFFITFGAQTGFVAYETLSSAKLPTMFEIYKILITSFVATLGFYGINKISLKRDGK